MSSHLPASASRSPRMETLIRYVPHDERQRVLGKQIYLIRMAFQGAMKDVETYGPSVHRLSRDVFLHHLADIRRAVGQDTGKIKLELEEQRAVFEAYLEQEQARESRMLHLEQMLTLSYPMLSTPGSSHATVQVPATPGLYPGRDPFKETVLAKLDTLWTSRVHSLVEVRRRLETQFEEKMTKVLSELVDKFHADYNRRYSQSIEIFASSVPEIMETLIKLQTTVEEELEAERTITKQRSEIYQLESTLADITTQRDAARESESTTMRECDARIKSVEGQRNNLAEQLKSAQQEIKRLGQDRGRDEKAHHDLQSSFNSLQGKFKSLRDAHARCSTLTIKGKQLQMDVKHWRSEADKHESSSNFWMLEHGLKVTEVEQGTQSMKSAVEQICRLDKEVNRLRGEHNSYNKLFRDQKQNLLTVQRDSNQTVDRLVAAEKKILRHHDFAQSFSQILSTTSAKAVRIDFELQSLTKGQQAQEQTQSNLVWRCNKNSEAMTELKTRQDRTASTAEALKQYMDNAMASLNHASGTVSIQTTKMNQLDADAQSTLSTLGVLRKTLRDAVQQHDRNTASTKKEKDDCVKELISLRSLVTSTHDELCANPAKWQQVSQDVRNGLQEMKARAQDQHQKLNSGATYFKKVMYPGLAARSEGLLLWDCRLRMSGPLDGIVRLDVHSIRQVFLDCTNSSMPAGDVCCIEDGGDLAFLVLHGQSCILNVWKHELECLIDAETIVTLASTRSAFSPVILGKFSTALGRAMSLVGGSMC